MKTPDFQKILDSCEIAHISFEGVLEEKTISPDKFIYKIKTNSRNFYVFEVDYISNLAGVQSRHFIP